MRNRGAFYLDLLERALWTGFQTFSATMIASGIDLAAQNASIAEKAIMAAIAGGISVMKSLASSQLPWTATGSASSVQ